MTIKPESMEDWKEDCLKWHKRVLTGEKSHWCYDWDGLPVDETTPEIDGCTCYSTVDKQKEKS